MVVGVAPRFRSRTLALVAACIVAIGALAANAQAPTQSDIGHLGGGSTSVNAVADGFVVGSSTIAGGYWQAFVWSAATGMTDIGRFLLSPASKATSVNSRGEVVGMYFVYEPSFSATGFYWSQATGVVTIGAVSGTNGGSMLINENGVVAGVRDDGHVFRWTRTGGLQDLGVTVFGDTYVSGINARGDIVGNSGSGSPGYAVSFIAYGSANSLTLLSSPGVNLAPFGAINEGNVNIQVNAINDSGVVVGTYWDYGYIWGDGNRVHNSHAFKWEAGAFTDLGNLGVVQVAPGYPFTYTFGASANAINDSGMIVGYSLRTAAPYAAFVYDPVTGLTQLPSLNEGDAGASATGINNDGVVVGYANQTSTSVMWNYDVPTSLWKPTNLTPSFAPQYPGSPLIKGSTIAGNGFDGGWNQHGWAMAIASTPPPPPDADGDGVPDNADVFPNDPSETRDSDGDGVGDNSDQYPNYVGTPPTQTLTILGGVGNVGDIAPNVEYYNPATGDWQPAYLADKRPGSPGVEHDWGVIAGTNHWINYKSNGSLYSDPGVGTTVETAWWYLYRVRFTVPADAQSAKMTFSLKADNLAEVAINGVSTGPTIDGRADQLNADAIFSQNVHPGENTITINVGDYGGLNGFNFRIDLSVQSAQPLEIVPPAPSDTTPPVIAMPANIVTEATGPSGAAVQYDVSATDVGGNASVSCSPTSGSTFAIGTTTVSCTATDAAGNTATRSFTVTVEDTTPPVITSVSGDLTAEATSAAGASVTFDAATATDAVGVVSITYSKASGASFAIGSTIVTVTARDGAGNSSQGTFTVTVEDTTPPVVTSVSGDLTAEATSAAGASVTYDAATATDAVGVVSITYSKASGTSFVIGTTAVTVTATDAAGNASSASFTVTVRDTTAPALASVTPSQATLWPPNHQMVAINVNAVATDAVGVASLKIIKVTSSEPDNGLGDGDTAGDIVITGPLSVNLRAERSGKGNGRIYTITVEARDAAGNASVKTCTVFVPKSQSGK